jgi:SAM-dependent methyltransferase
MIIRKEAERALVSTFNERKAEGSLLDPSGDYFNGSCNRWGLAISELSRASERGKILDIGAWEGVFGCALRKLGYDVGAVDHGQPMPSAFWESKGIDWKQCHVEADPLPFDDCEFTGVYMGQVLEHFTYSPKKPFLEIRRVLKPGGILVVDVPNISEWHNFYRLIRGKNVLYDYKEHYIDHEPEFYKGLPYFIRHNREFTRDELRVLAESTGFEVIKVSYIRSVRKGKKGFRRLEVPFSALRDVIPLFRKSLMLTARKPL